MEQYLKDVATAAAKRGEYVARCGVTANIVWADLVRSGRSLDSLHGDIKYQDAIRRLNELYDVLSRPVPPGHILVIGGLFDSRRINHQCVWVVTPDGQMHSVQTWINIATTPYTFTRTVDQCRHAVRALARASRQGAEMDAELLSALDVLTDICNTDHGKRRMRAYLPVPSQSVGHLTIPRLHGAQVPMPKVCFKLVRSPIQA